MRASIHAALAAGEIPAHEREEIERLVRLGQVFADQQRGRRPGPLTTHVAAVVERLAERTFEALLLELELDAVRHQLLGQGPIVRVDRAEGELLYLDRGVERAVSFGRLRNIARLRSHGSR